MIFEREPFEYGGVQTKERGLNWGEVDPAEWPGVGNSGFVRVSDGAGEALIFVDDDTAFDGVALPQGRFSPTGHVAQNGAAPFDSGHFLYLMSLGR